MSPLPFVPIKTQLSAVVSNRRRRVKTGSLSSISAHNNPTVPKEDMANVESRPAGLRGKRPYTSEELDSHEPRVQVRGADRR